jgi:hypothetical protein
MHTLGTLSSPDIDSSQTPHVDASMWIYLWDIVDEGYDAVFSFLKERKLTSISLACAYHAGKFLAPHNPKRKVVFLEDGTIYFRPNTSLFTTIRPVVNSLAAHGDDAASVKRAAERLGLETRAWVVCCHNSRIGAAYPSAACTTAFGDPLRHNLCPNNRDVREYLRAVLLSLAEQGIQTIELEALQFQGYSHGWHHEREGIPLPPVIRSLLGFCFCPSCMREATRAGVDIAAAQAWTRTTLEHYFADPSLVADADASFAAPPAEIFTPFAAWREAVIVSLAEELADAVSSHDCRLRPMTSVDPAAQKLVGMNPQKVAEKTGGVLALGYIKDGAALRPPLEALASRLGTQAMTVGMHVGMPESGGKKDFLGRMAAARSLGITSFNFYNYGFVPRAYIDWIPEALA